MNLKNPTTNLQENSFILCIDKQSSSSEETFGHNVPVMFFLGTNDSIRWPLISAHAPYHAPVMEGLNYHLGLQIGRQELSHWSLVTPPNSMSIQGCQSKHISSVVEEYTVQTMQATQNNLGLIRVFKPTILFQAPPLPTLQQILRPPELKNSAAAFWNQTFSPIGFPSFTAPPPPVSFHTEARPMVSSFCQASSLNSGQSSKSLESPPLSLLLDHEDSRDKSIICLAAKTRKKKYPCPLCDIRCSNNGQLQGHLRIHTGEKPFKCSFDGCDRRFARNEELTRHKRIHTGVRPHKCEICSKAFGRKDHLSKHKKTHLQVAEKKVFTCVVLGCGQKYSRSDALTRHQWTAHSLTKASSRAVKGLPRDSSVLQAINPVPTSTSWLNSRYTNL